MGRVSLRASWRAPSLARSAALAAVIAGPASAGEPVPTLRVAVPAGPDAVAGFDRDLFAEAAREAGFGVIFEVMPPEAAPAALDAGRVDVAAGPYRPGGVPGQAPGQAPEQAPGQPSGSPAGRRVLAALAPDGDALLKRRGDGSVKLPADAAGKVVGMLGPAPIPAPTAARLRAGAEALGARVALPPRAFPDPPGALAAGRVAALIGGLPEVAAAALARPDAFEVVGLVPGRAGPPPAAGAAVMRVDRPDLAGRIEAALGRMRADGRLAAAQRRWFGVAPAPAAASAAAPAPAGQPVATSKP